MEHHLFLHLLCDLFDFALTVQSEQIQLFIDELQPVLPLLLHL